MEELCHYPGKGGQAWQGHGPPGGGRGGVTTASAMGGCGGDFEDKRDVFGGM